MAAKRKKETFPAADAEKMTSAEISRWLDDKAKKFHAEYLLCLNGTQAAIRAGYAPGKNNASAAVTASRLLRCPVGRAYRNALVRESVEDMTLSRESVVLKLYEIYGRCMTAIPVMEWDEGKKEWVESGEFRFDAKGASKALEQIAKLMGFEAPKKLQFDGDGLEAVLKGLGGDRRY